MGTIESTEQKIPLDESKRILKIRLQELETLHTIFQHDNHVTIQDKYLWYKFLCQKPLFTNVQIKNHVVIDVTHHQIPTEERFINYLYDIGWDEHFNPKHIEEAKDFIRFWIQDDVCDLWESLQKIV